MADDDAGGTVLGFPGLTIPGPVGSGPPAPGAAAPSLTPLPTLAPPPSLMVAGNPTVGGGSSGGNAVAVNADPGIPDSPQGTGIAAMSVVMMAGITVAAMRGAWNAASYLKARHEHHRAIADQARAAADKASLGVEMARQKGRVQAGPEFGRSTRTSGGGGGRSNSGKNPTPGTFRSSSGPKSSGGSGSKTPSKTPGGPSGSRTPSLGTGGRGGGSKGRSGALESSGTKSGGKTRTSGGKTPTTGTKSASGSLTGAVRDRAADRVRNGPKPSGGKGGTGTLGTGKSGSGGTTPSSGSKSGRGSGAKTGTSGSKTSTSGTKPGGKGRVTLPEAVSEASERRLKKRRKRLSPPVLSTVRKGKGKKGGGKSGSGGSGPKRKGKGRVTLPAAIAAESARRLKKRRKRLDPPVLSTVRKGKKNKKSTPAGTAPGTTKVDLTKKPKPASPSGGTGSTKKVNLTKKPKPNASSGGPGGAGGGAPKVNLRKKVNLKKKTRRYGRPDGCFPGGKPGPSGPKSSGPKGSGPASGPSSRREQWERAGSRRSERASDTKTGTTGTGPGPTAGSGGTFGPPPGWGYSEGTTYTVEQIGPARSNRSDGRRPSGRTARGRAGLPAGTSRGGTVVTVPVPSKAPNTQYADSELTIFDVIESDADMAEEIMAGVDEARAAAEGCDKMMTKLEALHQKIVDLKVPGVLEGWVLILAEKAVSVKAKAEALAEKLPAASEAIRTAGENAERRHKPLADAVRDAGHTAPAERDYHVE
ncbi:hypothetical protein ACFXC9_30095 [Streptomyces naganishii]|uniref:hypothetical protein n=1 Tax=Streptomyces naganishii TaxID=285447 RepID=UPI003682F1E7